MTDPDDLRVHVGEIDVSEVEFPVGGETELVVGGYEVGSRGGAGHRSHHASTSTAHPHHHHPSHLR